MDKIEELLTRGVDKIYPSKEDLEKALRNGKKLKIYQGFDPTGSQLHIGHMVGLRKLKQWQELGHHVIFLIGDGTGQAGDPSGKIDARKVFFNQEELRNNAKDYIMQASKIVHFDGDNPIEIKYNGDWLNTITLPKLLDILGHFTLQQLIERDLFQERMKHEIPVNMREFIYPMLQGYDSVEMEVDVELGGSDQMFNMLTGRTLLKEMKNKDKFVMTTPLLTDSQGRKIGKTEGNVIGLTDKPEELFGKIMSLSDDIIIKGFEYLTDIPKDEIENIKQSLDNGDNPIEFKKYLAFELVKQLNSEEEAKNAEQHFEGTIQKGELPEDIPHFTVESKESPLLLDILVNSKLANSKSEAKRLLQQGGVELSNNVITNPTLKIERGEHTLKVGKRKYLKIVIE